MSTVIASSMLVCMLPITGNAYAEKSAMLMRTEDIDHAWQSMSANTPIKVIGDSTTTGLDTADTPETENASSASTHAEQSKQATKQTIWMKNTNTWAFGYVIEVKGIETGKSVTASVTNTSWGHDNEGQQGSGWYVTDTQQYTLTEDGVYTFLVNGYQTQSKILRPNRIFLLWVRQFDIKFDANVSMRDRLCNGRLHKPRHRNLSQSGRQHQKRENSEYTYGLYVFICRYACDSRRTARLFFSQLCGKRGYL